MKIRGSKGGTKWGDEGTEGNVSSRTLQRINKISREGLNIRFLLIREETSSHKFGEEMAFCFAHTAATDRCTLQRLTAAAAALTTPEGKTVLETNAKREEQISDFSKFYCNTCHPTATNPPQLPIT